MLEYINAASCMLLLVYCMPVASVMEAQHRWGLWAVFVLVVVCLTLQIIDPFASWVPAIGWPAVFLNVVMAAAVTIWRKEAWLFTRCRVGPLQEPAHPMRRTSDMVNT
jgi:K+ transporter